jgi:hypothetical protein
MDSSGGIGEECRRGYRDGVNVGYMYCRSMMLCRGMYVRYMPVGVCRYIVTRCDTGT